MKKILPTLFFLFSFTALFGQSLGEAKENFKQGRYMSAVYLLEDILRTQPKNATASYYLALSYLKVHHYLRALDAIMRIEANQLEEPDEYNFWRAYIHFLNEDFNETEFYIDLYEKQKSKKKQRELAELKAYLKNAKLFYPKKQEYTVINLGDNINTAFSEFNPLLDARQKSLFFHSNRATYADGKINKDEVQIYETYASEVNLKGDWKPAVLQKAGEDPVSAHQIVNNNVANGQKQLLVTSDGQLRLLKFQNGKWIEDETLKENDLPKQKSSHEYACLAPSGTLLVFSAANALNELDLYFSYRANVHDEWSKPKPINVLNSKKNEITPFILEENNKTVLFFSSNGHNSMGGYDIFASEFNPKSGAWTTPLNMGSPVNSVADDMSFSLRGDAGFLCSNRVGGYGGEDIYKCFLFHEVALSGKTLSRKTGEPVSDCEMSFFTDYGFTQDAKSNENGEYSVNLPVNELFHISIVHTGRILLQQDFFISAQSVFNRKVKSLTLNFYVQSEPVEFAFERPEEKPKHNFKKTLGSIFVLNNVYFKTGSADLDEKSFEELNAFAEFLSENAEMHIEIGGHTDNQGREVDNKKLSQKRAETVKNYLQSKSVAAERMSAVGYGSEMPIATNDIEEGGRALNRRIEVKVVR
jgi:outer membrane protein OmpA-like peptidoglycan-associated protein